MDILQKIQNKLVFMGFDGINIDEVADMVEDVTIYICSYCNISSLNAELNLVLVNLVIDMYKNIYYTKKTDDGQEITTSDGKNIASISVGDTSVNFGEGHSIEYANTKTHLTNLDDYIYNYTSILQKYRRLI